MTAATHLRVFRWDFLLLAALSLSIGWGIRGNFGHEYGAMIPGCLAAIAVCLLSGRQDWRERVAYFAAFGALGWGFGGSMSYMQVVAYAHSGHGESQLYAFFALFLIGFLWAGMGGAGTAFPAVASREQLTALFKPICWIFAFWLFKKWALWPLAEDWASDYSSTWNRHKSPLYWFDADWTEALTALVAVCCYDLYERRFGASRIPREYAWPLGICLALLAVFFYVAVPPLTDYHTVGIQFQWGGEHYMTPVWPAALALVGGTLLVFVAVTTVFYPLLTALAAVGGLLGWLIQQWLLKVPRALEVFLSLVARREGDPETYRRFAGLEDKPLEEIHANLMLNWPQFFEDHPQLIGVIFGILVGCAVYFALTGRFRDGSSLFVYMSLGWLLSFLLLPTLLGIRMTPPRGDDWAGILGVFLGTQIWLLRNRLQAAAWASWVCGILGGLAFAGGVWLKLMMVYPGNPNRPGLSPETIAFWQHYQHSNWHSFLEQSIGLFNGLAVAVALGLLARQVPHAEPVATTRRWTQVLAVSFVLFLLLYVNIYKNVREFVQSTPVPEFMNAPLLPLIPLNGQNLFEFSTAAWFNSVWIALSAAGIYLLVRHLRKPVALVPPTWLGRGQLLYLVFLWAIVVANFERAIPGFNHGRLLTEWVIFMNAILVSILILTRPATEGVDVSAGSTTGYGGRIVRGILLGLPVVLLLLFGMAGSVRGLYGDTFVGHAGELKRFGAEAEWRIKPIIKTDLHR